MVWRTEASGLCTHISDAWCRFVGRDAQHELGLGWTDHLHPQDRERVAEEVAHAYRSQSGFILRYRLRRYDGKWMDMKTHAMPWLDPITREFRGYWGSTAPQEPASTERGGIVVSFRERIVIAPALLTPSSDTSLELRS